jgi:lysophospholipase L1-like esterase
MDSEDGYGKDKDERPLRLSRRGFLKLVGAGAAILALGGPLKALTSILPVRVFSQPAPRIDYILKQGIVHPGKAVYLVGAGFRPDITVWIETNSGGFTSQGMNVRVINNTQVAFDYNHPASAEAHDTVKISVRHPDGASSNAVSIRPNTFNIIVLGDSVSWGQGLRENEKFHSIISEYVRTSGSNVLVDKQVLAHSGGKIGVNITRTQGPIHGEIPTAYPTILQQVNNWLGNPELVDLILVSGGINDVGIFSLFNPDPFGYDAFRNQIRKSCHDDMRVLLQKIKNKFTNPETKIIVTGYYRIASEDSDFTKVAIALCILGLALSAATIPFTAVFACLTAATLAVAARAILINKSRIFQREANNDLREAVDSINFEEGLQSKNFSSRIFFVDPQFGPRNSIFGPEHLVYGLQIPPSNFPIDLSPFAEDSLKWYRRDRCNEAGSRAPSYCKIASVGHPNPAGARRYADSIIPVINIVLQRPPPSQPVESEDCINFDPLHTSAQNVNGRWKIVVDNNIWMLDFGDNQANAQRALDIIRYYGFTSQCFVGRPNPPMQYYLVNRNPPQGAFTGEDCVLFNPQTTTVQQIQGTWKVVDGSHWILDFGSNENNARLGLDIIRRYGFNSICFVGRPNPPMMYFRR